MLSPIFGEDDKNIMFVEQTETSGFSLSIVKLRSMTPTVFASVNEAEDYFLNKFDQAKMPAETDAASLYMMINRTKNLIAGKTRRGIAGVVLLGSNRVAKLNGSLNNKNIGRWSGLDVQSPYPSRYFTSTDMDENDIFVIYNKGNSDSGAIINVDHGVSLYEHSESSKYGFRFTV
jgi:hypothetical protein